MALKHYCTQCGAKHEYTLILANFCFACGSPMKAGVVAAKVEQPPSYTVPESPPQPVAPKKLSLRERLLAERQEVEEDDETEIEEPVIIPKNPGFSIEVPKTNKESIGSIAVGPTQAGPRIREKRDGLLITKNKKEFLKQFRKMAGTEAQGKEII